MEVGIQVLLLVLEDAEVEEVQVVDKELNPVDPVIQVIMDTELMDMHQDQVEAAVPVHLVALTVETEELFQAHNFQGLMLAVELAVETLVALAVVVMVIAEELTD